MIILIGHIVPVKCQQVRRISLTAQPKVSDLLSYKYRNNRFLFWFYKARDNLLVLTIDYNSDSMKADMLGLFSFNFSQNFGKIEQISIDAKILEFWHNLVSDFILSIHCFQSLLLSVARYRPI